MTRNRTASLALLAFVFASAGAAFAAHICPDNYADINGTYVQKNNQGVIKKKFQITGFKSYAQVETLDLDDGSVVRKAAWVWTNASPLIFSKANKNQQRLKEATRGGAPTFNITVEVFDKDCITIKTITWEKESS